MYIYNNIQKGNTSIEKIEEDQNQFKSKLNEIITRDPGHKSKIQVDTMKNIKNIYNSREKVIKLYKDYANVRSEAMNRAKQGTGLKILTPNSFCTNKGR